MTGKMIKIGVAVLVAAAALSAVGVRAADYEKTILARKLQRKAELLRKSQFSAIEGNREWLKTRVIDGGNTALRASFDTPLIRDNTIPRESFAGMNTPSSIQVNDAQDIAITTYDYQANSSQAYNVARIDNTPGERLHFTWMSFQFVPVTIENSSRYAFYSGVDDPEDYPTMGDFTYDGAWATGATQRGGYCNIDVVSTNRAHVGLHNAASDYDTDPYRPVDAWFVNGDDLPQEYALGGQDASCPGSAKGTGGVLWPRIAADRSSATLFAHEIAHSNVNNCAIQKLWYWRYSGVSWSATPGFISETDEISYALAVSGFDDKIGIATHKGDAATGFTNVYYLQSLDNGTSWLPPNTTPAGPPPAPTAITNYVSGNPNDERSAGLHLTATYDNAGVLNVMWDEQETPGSNHVAIKHWRNAIGGGPVDVTFGYWDCPQPVGVFTDNLSKLSIGIGDGSVVCNGTPNNNFVYCTYTQFGGITTAQLTDFSDETSEEGRSGGYMNGEVYVVVSNSLGSTWSPATNLTNTRTAGCNPGVIPAGQTTSPNPGPPCASEHWSTLNRTVSDIDICYILDKDAGGIPQGEGSWQFNPVMYLQLSGTATTNLGGVCPIVNPVFSPILEADATCEYNAPRNGQQQISLDINNTGNAALNQGGGSGIAITGFPGLPTLTMTGSLGNYSVLPANVDSRTVTMASNGAAEGLYTGHIIISHNDPDVDNPSPRDFVMDFFVFDEFFCPEAEILKTGVSSPGILALAIGSDGRFARQTGQGTLWRYSDSSQSLSDGSLLLAHGTQGPGVDDTTVFLYYADRTSNGQNGWRSQSEFAIDTGNYGPTDAGYATASAYMSTSDSVMGCNMTWYFPQHPDYDEVVICTYTIMPGPNWAANGKPAINNVDVGVLTDFDCFPGQWPPLDTSQVSTNNKAINHVNNVDRELAFFSSKKKAGYTGAGLQDPERFRAGILVPSGYQGSFTGFFAHDLDNGGGPTDGRLYNILETVGGAEFAAVVPPNVSDTDRYVLMGIEQGQTYMSLSTTYEISTMHQHVMILVSDTVDEASFLAKCDAAAVLVGFPYPGANKSADALAPAFAGCGTCPCRYDPDCDGEATIIDVSHCVGGAFRNITSDPAVGFRPTMATCQFDSRDVDANGVIDVLDVSKAVGVAFRNVQVTAANSFSNPCSKFKEWF